MAKEASTSELLKEAKETNKKITVIGNILNNLSASSLENVGGLLLCLPFNISKY